MSENIPEKKFTAGAISATVWTNKRQFNGSEVEIQTVSLQKAYKDKEGAWKHTQSLRSTDIPKARLVLDKVYEHLTLTKAEVM
ncbi:MAG: hypothetical protein ACI8Y7_000576 [Candidatus Woesearchaeota archaeon]|jgi:hypothetical protein